MTQRLSNILEGSPTAVFVKSIRFAFNRTCFGNFVFIDTTIAIQHITAEVDP